MCGISNSADIVIWQDHAGRCFYMRCADKAGFTGFNLAADRLNISRSEWCEMIMPV